MLEAESIYFAKGSVVVAVYVDDLTIMVDAGSLRAWCILNAQ